MATLEELRKKRLQDLQTRPQSSALDDARSKRLEELRTQKRTFTEKPAEIQNTIDTGRTAGQAFRQSAAVDVLPSATGILATAGTMALAGSVVPGVGNLVAGIAGLGVGIGTAIATKKAQDKVLEVTKGAEWKRNLEQSIAEDRKAHPFATLAGETVPSLITFKPSPSTLKQAFNFGKRILTDPKTLSKHITTLEGKTELDALINVGVGAGVDVSLETYQQAREGDFNALRILASGVIGGTISDPNRLGVKLGFSPTGDAVIEEFNKFGSQTPAAKIITKGDVPVIDRSSDALFMERKELSAILRGEYEANRFTDPRILRAEKISGTIDKDVTPDSDLNIYRLDGRGGPMRVGERVTANPFIADVFGGRINPEATVKAGDLVRTSKGDYVYIPKDQIAGEPVLPPVTNAVEGKVQKDVLKKELTALDELRIKKLEEKRLAEEPARLQKEAEELAAKEQADAEARFQKETEQAQKTKLSLEEKIVKARAEKIKKLKQEKIRVETERKTIDKNTDKEIESITVQLRKDLNEATLDHVKRLSAVKTKVQKAKENIRFKNLKANLTAKAIKTKKKVRETTAESKKKVQSNAEVIRQQTDEAISNLKKEIKSVPKPKLEKVEGSAKPKEVPAKPAQVSTKLAEEPTPELVQDLKDVYDMAETPSDFGNDMADMFVRQQKKAGELPTYASMEAQAMLRESKNFEIGIPTKDIKQTPGNKNFDSVVDKKVKEIESGQSPLVYVDKNNTIIDGNHAFLAYKKLGYKIIPAIKPAEVSLKSTPAPKTTTIGTKTVKSESIIKNAVQDAKQYAQKAQELDPDFTSQMGTTFVEQRKLASELITEKGFDNALKFAIEASDADMRKLNLDRASLYSELSKIAVKEGQFVKYRDDLEQLGFLAGNAGSTAAQSLSLQRMINENDPFRRVAGVLKQLIDNEKDKRGSVFKKEVDELYAKLKEAGTEEDLNKIINDNLC